MSTDHPVVPVPTDQEITVVAKAMDVDGKLDWASTDHDAVVACMNAKADARTMIVGFEAVEHLSDLVAADNARIEAEKQAAIDAQAAAEAEAADKAEAAAEKAA